MSTTEETKEKPRESGSPSIKPAGTDCSEKRAISTKTVAKPGLNAKVDTKVDTRAGTSAKPSSSKTTTTKAAGARPTNRRQKAKEDAKCVVAGVSTREWPTFKVEDPSKAKYAERKRAAYILRRAHRYPPTKEELTKELQETLECAKAVLPNFSMEPPVVATKRQKSAEEAKPSAKRPKTRGELPNRSFAEVARNRIIIGVLDEGDPEGKIPRTQWKWVQAALANVALEVLLSNPGPPPSCTDAGWYQGQIKLVACDDERSVQLYKAAIAKVGEVYPGAKLIAVDKKDISSRPRARVWIPATPSQPEQIMQLIKACNPNLPTEGWKFVKAFEEATTESGVETKRATMQILLLLTNDSIEPLKRSGGEINYGFTKVKVKTYKADAGAIDHLTSDNEMGEVEEDPMESSSDIDSLEQAN
ncbi:uncharacterized protein LOC128921471 isoform X2 [Zeugodacus cucurbitae]|uniref:uncharacterized protein LOC128921471 isoform X2 n=1 Tax=Zeugodacus cucurbitae TaxID=28588 RepID=UPI0023D8FD1C|nr:uncharacterized protein LOC128921471 isoform X2 [Zeugodacus cucurbitae]